MKKLIASAILLLVSLVALVSVACGTEAIQTQMSTDGIFDLSLIRARVSGDVLTVQVLFKNTSSKKSFYRFAFGNVYYTDTKEKKKYYGLKDAEGRFIAGPAEHWISGGSFGMDFAPGATEIFWIKFPAPPESTETIDIYIPWALPFEDVKVER